MRKKVIWVMILLAVIATGCSSGQPNPMQQGAPVLSQTAPAEAENLDRKAEQELKAGKVSSAVSLWERIAQNYPNTALAAKSLYRVGGIYLERGQPERAIQFFDFLLYTYPRWEGVNQAQLDRLRALSATGKKKQVMKEATTLWQASAGQPEVQLGLSQLMAQVYLGDKDLETSFEWLTAGFGVAQNPEDQKALTKTTLEVLKNADDGTVQKLLKKNPPEVMRVFLEYRLIQAGMQKGQGAGSRDRLRELLASNPTHPLAFEIQAALRGAPPSSTGPSIPLNPDRVGCLLPLNGQYEKYGHLVMRGLSMALDDYDRNRGGQSITLAVRDAQTEREAVKSFEELAKDEGVMSIIGPLGTQAAKAVTPLANRFGIPLLALTQKEDEPSDNTFVVHIFLDNRDLVESLVKYCREKLGYTRFAALYPDDRYGQRLSKIFAEVVKEQGGELLASVAYKEKTTDFKDPINKLMNVAKQNTPPTGVDVTPFQALFIPDQVQTVSLIAPQLPYLNVVGATLLGTNLWGEAPLVQAGGAYVEQAIFATPFFPESDAPKVRTFREEYQAIYQETPSYLEAQAYDAMTLFLDARSALRGRGADRISFMQNLLQIRGFQGVAGVYSFNQAGDLKRDYHILQVQNGQLVQLGR